MTQNLIPIADPDDFVAAIPAIVGMIPEDGMSVMVVLDSDALIQLTLVVPMTRRATKDAIRHLKTYDPETHGLIVAYVCEDLERSKAMIGMFGSRYPVPLVSLFLIQEYTPGAPYIEPLIPKAGYVPDYRDSELTAEVIADGRMVNRTMADIAAIYEPTEPAVVAAPTEPEDVPVRLSALGEAVTENQPFDPALIGGLLVHSTMARDWTLKVAYIQAAAAHTIFAEAGRRLRGIPRVEALTAAGLAAYVDGEGVMARHAIFAAKETANQCRPVYIPTLAMTLDEALNNGVPPSLIAHAVFAELYDQEDKQDDD